MTAFQDSKCCVPSLPSRSFHGNGSHVFYSLFSLVQTCISRPSHATPTQSNQTDFLSISTVRRKFQLAFPEYFPVGTSLNTTTLSSLSQGSTFSILHIFIIFNSLYLFSSHTPFNNLVTRVSLDPFIG